MTACSVRIPGMPPENGKTALMANPFRKLATILLIGLSGCALINTDRGLLSKNRQTLKPEQVADFENDAPVRRVVRLQTSVVTALADDRRMRSLAWEELDESGLMSPEDRRRLNQSGIRVGVSGGTLPWALASLLRGERESSASQGSDAENQSSALGSHVALSEGSSSVVELPVLSESLFIPAGEIAGLKNGAELQNARLLLEMNAVQYGNGWVVIRFLPQIHHGAVTSRYSVSGTREQLPTRQKIQPLYEQQFQIKLHIGEMVVIGCQHRPEWTIGRLLFQRETLSAQQEHLVGLRLGGIEEVTGEKSMTINYSRY